VVAFEAAGCALRLLGIKVEKPRGGAGGFPSTRPVSARINAPEQ
jgi:hypothetical protein